MAGAGSSLGSGRSVALITTLRATASVAPTNAATSRTPSAGRPGEFASWAHVTKIM
jgi:hypothetical protein